MKNKKNIMILVTVFLIPILLVFAIIFGVKNGKYQDAKKYAENYMFQKAEKLFLELNNFQDSAAQVEEMARLTKMNRNDTKRLIPGSENQPTYKANYWCVEHKIGLSISWYSDQEELYTLWGEYAAWGTDRNFVNVFFSEEIGNSKIVRYDQSTGEYIFLQCTKENDRYYDSMPMVEWYRGVLNEDRSLELYNSAGERYLFFLYATHTNQSIDGETILNPELTPYVEAGAPES